MKTALYNGQVVRVLVKSARNCRIRKDERFPDDTCLVPTSSLVFNEEPRYQPTSFSRTNVGEENFNKFLDLATALSPENLTCDGELPRSQVIRRRNHLLQQWAALEKKIGLQVTESMVWDEFMKTRK